jgi:L-amino acid N-acyltransferase YncA
LLEIRPAVRADAAEIARVHVETWRAAYAHALPHEALSSLSVAERATGWTEWLAKDAPRTTTLVAERGEWVVGFASVGPSRDDDADDGVAELYAVYVVAEEWGRGVGRRLLSEAAEAMRAAGFREATLWVLDDNPRARRAYEAAGWKLDGAEKEDVVLGEVHVTELRYRKPL